jgi:hypothetical protein
MMLLASEYIDGIGGWSLATATALVNTAAIIATSFRDKNKLTSHSDNVGPGASDDRGSKPPLMPTITHPERQMLPQRLGVHIGRAAVCIRRSSSRMRSSHGLSRDIDNARVSQHQRHLISCGTANNWLGGRVPNVAA